MYIMEDNRKEQIEALQVLTEFNGRLVKNMSILVKELSGERLDDTDTGKAFLHVVGEIGNSLLPCSKARTDDFSIINLAK